MSYEVLARKWRPRQFADVVGQDHVVQTLRNAIKGDRLANAYLFVGPRGIGKTSIARIFAKALDCEKGVSAEPCDKCDACREIAAGTSLDVLEIDGASNNGVEQVRELRDTVKFAPARGKYKIYIIDEVHMLSPAAFNALLKTLEEPPSHVKFIFATTEPDKILPTILSRCQRFDLRRIPDTLIAKRLREIAESEDLAVDDDALLAIARMADGGLRDAESALDQLVSFRGKSIAEEDVLSVFGLVSRATLEGLAESVLKPDLDSALKTVADLDGRGKDLQRLLVDLLGQLRDLLVFLHLKGNAASALDAGPDRIETLRRQSGLTTPGRVMRIVDILTRAAESVRFALSRRVLLETALIRCVRASSTASLEELLAAVNELLGRAGAEEGPPQAQPGRREAAAPAYDARASARPGAAPAAVRESPSEPPEAAGGDRLARLRESWAAIVRETARLSMGAANLLKDAWPESVDGDRVTIAVDSEFKQEITALESPRHRMSLESALRRVLGPDATVSFVAADKGRPGSGRQADKGPPAAAPDAEDTAGQPRGQRAAPAGSPKKGKAWADDPSVRKVMETFNSTIVEVRE